ncbi:MAG: S24 family peptidase [Kiritimatiellia bacterium]
MSSIGDRIKILRGKMSRDDYAERIGVSKNTIVSYEKGSSTPNHQVMTRILDRHKSLSPAWLMSGTGPQNAPSSSSLPAEGRLPPKEESSFGYVPLVKTILSAGGGAFVLSEEIEEYHAFKLQWLNSIATCKKGLFLMRVRGDSMFPTIQNKDVVLVDAGRKTLSDGEIFALRVNETVIIKRLSYRVGGKVVVISDNRGEYPAYEVTPDDVNIIGQVIYFSRVLIPEKLP